MADDIIHKWTTAKTTRNTQRRPYPEMAVYATELEFDGNWDWIGEPDKIGNKNLEVAKTIGYQSKGVRGEYQPNNLAKEIKYEVQFVVIVKEEVKEIFEVELGLIRPDGTPKVHTKNLNQGSKNIWIGLKVGEFTNNQTESNENIKFSLKSADGLNLKDGLIVIGVIIVPVANV